MNRSIFRPIQQALLGAFGIVIIVIALSAWLTWRESILLDRAEAQFERGLAFGEAHRDLEIKLAAFSSGTGQPDRHGLIEEIETLITLSPIDDVETRRRLEDFRGYLMATDFERLAQAGPPSQSTQAVSIFHEIAISASRNEAEALGQLKDSIATQLRYELASPIVLLLLGLIAIPIARRRIIRPLETFGQQISGIAAGNFAPTPAEHLDSHTLPLHRNLIKLAIRLEELEREHLQREASLEDEVRTATSALLEQQHSLARAERLAVAGELAANMAHEVRNPLAGIQMSLSNMRDEIESPDLVERIDLVIEEVMRLTRLVNEIVDASRHIPESPTAVDFGELIDELISLTRYQLPADITIESRVETGLSATTSKERLRQVLLNLVLNSAGALGQDAGHIEIAVTRVPKGVNIVVSDDGPGFPAALLDGGIRAFYSTRKGGTGLGLAMVRRFAREAEGRLTLENGNGPGERPGARVSLLLPFDLEHG